MTKGDHSVLVITAADCCFQSLENAMAGAGDPCQLRRANDLSSGLARLAGGGIHTVVLDISNGKLTGVIKVRDTVPHLPLVLWSNIDDERLPHFVNQYGAVGYLAPHSSPQDLKRLLAGTHHQARPSGSVIAMMGAKGGVGTTTVAMNVAASLTIQGTVILAELRSSFGTVQSVLYPGQNARGIGQLRADIDTTHYLWPAPGVPGLRVLFGPQTPQDCGELDPTRAVTILRGLAQEADFLILDLPTGLSAANRALIEASHHLALVVKPVAHCVRLAKLTLEGVHSWEHAPQSIGTVVVKPAADGDFLPLGQIEDLGVPILKVIPPAPALCKQAERVHLPLVFCDPESLVAENFADLARCFQTQITPRNASRAA
jgi:MinD-like ATPase involved in chromosome partitioning or flagellar assembly